MGEPHWLVQELAGEAVWTAVTLGSVWAWSRRKDIAHRLRGRTPVLLSGVLEGGAPWAGDLSVGFNETATLNVVATARIRMTYNPYDGEWITSRIPLE